MPRKPAVALTPQPTRTPSGSGGATPACTRTSPSRSTRIRSPACTAGTRPSGSPAGPRDRPGDIAWTRPGPAGVPAVAGEDPRRHPRLPDGSRRPKWLMRPLKPSAEAWRCRPARTRRKIAMAGNLGDRRSAHPGRGGRWELLRALSIVPDSPAATRCVGAALGLDQVAGRRAHRGVRAELPAPTPRSTSVPPGRHRRRGRQPGGPATGAPSGSPRPPNPIIWPPCSACTPGSARPRRRPARRHRGRARPSRAVLLEDACGPRSLPRRGDATGHSVP